MNSRDVGKPIFESQGIDIASGAATVEYFADLAVDICGRTLPAPYGDVLDYTVHESLGVVATVMLWKILLLIACRKVARALAAGNTVVLKRSSWAPPCPLAPGDIFGQAGLAAGALNVITSPGRVTGQALARHPDVHGVNLTGSTEVRRSIMSPCVAGLKGYGVTLGGKSPASVLLGCDMDGTISGTLFGACLNQGECCCAASRVLVHEAVYDCN